MTGVAVDLWTATATGELAADWREALPAHVLDQLEGRRDVERHRRVVQLALRRSVLAHAVDRPMEEIELQLPAGGGPNRRAENIWASASHHDAVTVLGVSTAPLGVDIEPEYEEDWDAALDSVLTAGELQALRELPASRQAGAYFLCWTLKEAVMKALGEGLSDRDPQTVEVGFRSTPPTLLGLDGVAPADDWTLRTTRVARGYVASVAVRGVKRVTLRRHGWPIDLPSAAR